MPIQKERFIVTFFSIILIATNFEESRKKYLTILQKDVVKCKNQLLKTS
jgi:hypothetical protein